MARHIHYKTREELEIMKRCGKILKGAVDIVVPQIKEGMTTEDIDLLSKETILKLGGEPSFDKVPGYHWTTCVPVNEQIVHTPPSKYKLKKGDIFTLDIGAYLEGFHTDYATTVLINDNDEEKSKFLKIGEVALENSLKVAAKAQYLGEISQSIENDIYGNGYFILHQLTGHGIGKELHEAPYVPGILDTPVKSTTRVADGLVVAVEVIYSMGSEEIAHEKGNDWSIVTSDLSLSACFEKTIAFFDKKMFILT